MRPALSIALCALCGCSAPTDPLAPGSDVRADFDRTHLDCRLDASTHLQTWELSLAGAVLKSHTGDVAYLDAAAHLASGFYLELGRTPAGEIETAPIGWTYSNLHVVGGHEP